MLDRKSHTDQGTELPEKWLTKLRDLLNQVYGETCQNTQKTFEVFGKVFPEEVWMATSFLDPNDQTATPITYMVSADLNDEKKMDALLDLLIDSIGLFFDIYFSSHDWDDYTLEWTDSEIKGQEFFYRSTRENIALTLMADKLLQDSNH